MPYCVAYCAGFCSEIFAKLTNTVPAVPLDGVKMSRKYMFFDNTRDRTELGFEPTSVELALKQAVDYFLQNKNQFHLI